MLEKTRKLIQWICLGIAILGSLSAILFAMNQAKFSGMYNVAYGILLLCCAFAIVAILFFLIKATIKGGRKGLLIGLGLMIVVALVAFLLSKGSDLSNAVLEKYDVTEGTSKLIGAGCIMTYIIFAVTCISIVYVEVAKAFKK